MMIGLAASPPTPDHTSVHIWEGSAGVLTSSTDMQLVVEHSGNAGIAIMSPNANTTQLAFGSPQDNRQGGILYDHNANTLQLRASGVTRATIDSGGKLGLGVTVPEFQLHIKNGGTDSGASFHARNSLVVEKSGETGIAIGTTNGDSAFLDFSAPQSSYDGRIQYSQGNRDMYFYTSAAIEFTIKNNGDIHDSSGAIHSNSDERIKENVVDSAFGLAEVLQLRPVDFNFCSWYTNEEVNPLQTGFIAQEVKEVVPNVVKIKPHETPFDFTDPDGTPHHLHDPIPDIHSIQDQQLIPMLVKAVQELKAEVDALKG
jgi:hypothetical protein